MDVFEFVVSASVQILSLTVVLSVSANFISYNLESFSQLNSTHTCQRSCNSVAV